MSQYTTDQVLRMLEEWAEKNPGGPWGRFQGCDVLLGADLSEIDLSTTKIQKKAEEYRKQSDDTNPPWLGYTPVLGDPVSGPSPSDLGVDLCGALLSKINTKIRLGNADLRGAHFLNTQLQGAVLQGAQLQGAHLLGTILDAADLSSSDLHGAYLEGARLNCANLERANLQNAELAEASLQQALLGGAQLKGAYLGSADSVKTDFEAAQLGEVDWNRGYDLHEEYPEEAETVYRRLKRWYSNNGQYHHAGEFHKQEMRVRRKNLWQQHSYPEAAYLWLMGALSGYGERPSWTLVWTLLTFGVFASGYAVDVSLSNQILPGIPVLREILAGLFLSASAMLTFTPDITDSFFGTVGLSRWVSWVALLQGAIAYFLLALFLVTFVQKASRQ